MAHLTGAAAAAAGFTGCGAICGGLLAGAAAVAAGLAAKSAVVFAVPSAGLDAGFGSAGLAFAGGLATGGGGAAFFFRFVAAEDGWMGWLLLIFPGHGWSNAVFLPHPRGQLNPVFRFLRPPGERAARVRHPQGRGFSQQ